MITRLLTIGFSQTAFATALVLALVFPACPSSAEEALTPLQQGNWPTKLEAVVDDLVSRLSAENKEILRKTKKDRLILFHHGWGTGIRNHYELWRGNAELIKAACGAPCHPDDASMKIIEAVWAKLQK
ncbi:DUF6794 domain-containing protein [Microvirga terricola]|uniref:DUF6794 domain-containing protein n=1 Tax=Microvirga terricola TaxID=2719797 RepID=A0ABX0VG87_9HYPH|nr:DUF6794 domain-containing protein [Microvirga terricola]NIX78020.1 hypothetical protein [Microvirga terricola]